MTWDDVSTPGLTSAYPADQGMLAGLVGQTTILWAELEMASTA